MFNNIEFLCGVAGFAGFECLKIYKRIWARRAFIPRKQIPLYVFSIAGLAIFSGFVASSIAPGNLLGSIFIGFSVPTNAKAIFEPSQKNYSSKAHDIDDIELIDNEEKNKIQILYDLIFSFK